MYLVANVMTAVKIVKGKTSEFDWKLVDQADHRRLKIGPDITSIATKPKVHNVIRNDIVSFWV